MRIKIGTFNLLNLVEPGVRYYNKKPYRPDEFEEKTAWITRQLARMDADFVGFQEVFHESALKKVIAASGLFDGGTVGAPGANGRGPHVGFATSLKVVGEPQLYEVFPDDLDFSIEVEETGEKISIPIRKFSRPVLEVVVELGNGHTAAVFIAHLKSKRPLVDGDKRHDPIERAIGKARSLIVRASEAAAFRSLLVQEMQHTKRPVIVLGDLNDAVHAVTTEIVAGTPPWRRMPLDVKKPIWDVLLYSTYDIQARNSYRKVSYSHIHNGHYDTLDHILVSEEFYKYNHDRIAEVEYLHFFNDHLVDDTLSHQRRSRIASDHGQVVVTIKLKD